MKIASRRRGPFSRTEKSRSAAGERRRRRERPVHLISLADAHLQARAAPSLVDFLRRASSSSSSSSSSSRIFVGNRACVKIPREYSSLPGAPSASSLTCPPQLARYARILSVSLFLSFRLAKYSPSTQPPLSNAQVESPRRLFCGGESAEVAFANRASEHAASACSIFLRAALCTSLPSASRAHFEESFSFKLHADN